MDNADFFDCSLWWPQCGFLPYKFMSIFLCKKFSAIGKHRVSPVSSNKKWNCIRVHLLIICNKFQYGNHRINWLPFLFRKIIINCVQKSKTICNNCDFLLPWFWHAFSKNGWSQNKKKLSSESILRLPSMFKRGWSSGIVRFQCSEIVSVLIRSYFVCQNTKMRKLKKWRTVLGLQICLRLSIFISV